MSHPATSAIALAMLVLVVSFVISGVLAVLMDLCFGHHGQSFVQHYAKGESDNSHTHLKSVHPYPTDKYENIFTFIQLSDLHISKFRQPEIEVELKEFCTSHLPLISPALVLLTGDLVDAKDISNHGSEQYIEEWKAYHSVVNHCHNNWKGEWLEVRGNHDAFGILDHNDPANMFKHYSRSKSRYGKSGSYQHVMSLEFGTYSFNALDFAPNPGPKRPYNFFGVMEEEDLKFMQTVSEKRHLYNLTIWFGHYPLSTITTTSLVRNIVSRDIAYLCGHLHTLGNILPSMHLMLPNGHMELESGDWKASKRYRILAVDHDLLSFVDVTYPSLPVVLITNPIQSRYADPRHQSFERMRKSSHIRFLVFSKDAIKGAQVVIDGHTLCERAKHVAQQLYVCPWTPSQYATGRHDLMVTVTDGREETFSHNITFSLEGIRESSLSLGALIMFLDFCLVTRTLFCCVFLVVVMLPYYIRQMLISNEKNMLQGVLPYLPVQMTSFLKNDKLFRPWFFYNLYSLVGPVFIGEIVPGKVGICFVHGLLVNNRWLPGTLTYITGALQLLLFSLPLAIYLGELSSKRNSLPKPTKSFIGLSMHRIKSLIFHSLFSLIVSIQVTGALQTKVAYGNMAFLLSPVKTWSVPFAIWLVYQAIKIAR